MCNMYEMNLSRLLDACCVNIPPNQWNAMYDYFIENEIDLNCINIDNLYVNGVSYIDLEDIKEKHTILVQADGGYYLMDISQGYTG